MVGGSDLSKVSTLDRESSTMSMYLRVRPDSYQILKATLPVVQIPLPRYICF